MNSAEKATVNAQIRDESKCLEELRKAYKQAKKDVQERLKALNARTDMQNLQTIIHQRKYQEQLLKQIDSVLNDLETHSYKTANEFFQGSYQNGYIGSMYELMKQGIPITVPVSTQKMVTAIQTDSKLSRTYYLKKGLSIQNIRTLKKQIALEATRGIASGKSWLEVAESLGVQRAFAISQSDAIRIVRTEGNRINQQGRLDSGDEAVKAGCDLLKQWDATLDSRTREAHREADGQIVKWDEDFTVGGEKMKAPSIGGSASNVCNCRCQLLKRPRWALDDEELEVLKKRAEYYGLDKSDSFEEYKEKYLNLPQNAETINVSNVLKTPVDSAKNPQYNKLKKGLEVNNVVYNPVLNHAEQLSDEDIIEALSGGDKTYGSCASLGLAFIGQRQGWDVLDFRDGASRSFFSRSGHLYTLAHMDGMIGLFYGDVKGKSSCTLANNFLKQCEIGKEYYLCVGRHASIVRKNEDGVLQYLELQSATKSGWTKFNGNPRYTLTNRFGCSSSSGHGEKYDFMLNITDSNFNTDEFKSLLGYINTDEKSQVKGHGGTIK